MKNALLLLSTLFLVSSCGLSFQDKEVTINEQYSVTVPGSLTETDLLNDEASLQYMNALSELYIVVIDEPKSDFEEVVNGLDSVYFAGTTLDIFKDIVISNFEYGVPGYQLLGEKDTTINGMGGVVLNIGGNVDGMDVKYIYSILESEESLYQVITWTLTEKYEDHLEDMNTMIYSFKEI